MGEFLVQVAAAVVAAGVLGAIALGWRSYKRFCSMDLTLKAILRVHQKFETRFEEVGERLDDHEARIGALETEVRRADRQGK